MVARVERRERPTGLFAEWERANKGQTSPESFVCLSKKKGKQVFDPAPNKTLGGSRSDHYF